MSKKRLEHKIQSKIEEWIDIQGNEFILCIKEFCQGNRYALCRISEYVEELGTSVFAGQSEKLNSELLEELEYAMFDLIGEYSSTPGGDELILAVRGNIVDQLTIVFAEAKRRWNLQNYKITESIEELDPQNNVIPDEALEVYTEERLSPKESKQQAREVLDELLAFVQGKFRGDKKRVIAVNWLENPELQRDFKALATLVNSSTGSVKVTLTRIKQTIAQSFTLNRSGNRLVLNPVAVNKEERAPSLSQYR